MPKQQPQQQEKVCPKCNGRGLYESKRDGFNDGSQTQCTQCGGTGRVK